MSSKYRYFELKVRGVKSETCATGVKFNAATFTAEDVELTNWFKGVKKSVSQVSQSLVTIGGRGDQKRTYYTYVTHIVPRTTLNKMYGRVRYG